MAASPTTMQTVAASGYFVDQKKGEVNELKQLLKNINVERDTKKKREIIKKVIAYMTLGIDVSRLFTDMIMAIETKDIVVKKMVYLYLCNYAHKEPEMALMCINTLRRDCDNEDPMVRGLALRSLCSLRLESILEYIQQPIQKSLTDVSPYVRKTGVMGILKLKYLSPSMIESSGYIEQLQRMVQDVDANVVVNAIFALNELLLDQGGFEVTHSMVLTLLNRISEFNEWGLNTVLELVARFTPSSEEETYAIMNLLDPVLRTANSGAVLATLKCFLRLTSSMPEIQVQIYARAKPPMLTLITGAAPEIQYTMLKHLQVILEQPIVKGIFDDEFRQFFVRYNEPPYVKHLKVDVLPLVSNDINARDIATELSEYVTDVDAELSKRAIAAIAEIGMRVPSVAGDMATSLVALVDLDMNYVRAEAMKNMVNLLRIYPAARSVMLPSISRCFKRVSDDDARSALIWIVGEYGDEVMEAPYLLENIINNYHEESSTFIKLQLLTSTMKLFLKRPPEVQAMLGRLLRSAIVDDNNNNTNNNNNSNHHGGQQDQDVHDRALLYYRLLIRAQEQPEVLLSDLFAGLGQQSMMVGQGGSLRGYAEKRESEKLSKIFQEFNTLSVMYNQPANKFIEEPYQFRYESLPMAPSAASVAATASATSASAATSATPAASSASAASSNLLDFDDHSNNINNNNNNNSHSNINNNIHNNNNNNIVNKWSLLEHVEMSPQIFQQHWLALNEAFAGLLGHLTRVPSATADIEAALRQSRIFTMASGPLNQNGVSGVKLFIYGGEGSSPSPSSGMTSLFLAQLLVMSNGEVSVTVKATNPTSLNNFLETLAQSLQHYR